ncbi:Serine/threonine-protein kinase sax-1, partial [Frankliniella fusca]
KNIVNLGIFFHSVKNKNFALGTRGHKKLTSKGMKSGLQKKSNKQVQKQSNKQVGHHEGVRTLDLSVQTTLYYAYYVSISAVVTPYYVVSRYILNSLPS